MKKKIEWSSITLRITSKMIKEIKKAIPDNIGMSRNAWILLAIQEKLKRKK